MTSRSLYGVGAEIVLQGLALMLVSSISSGQIQQVEDWSSYQSNQSNIRVKIEDKLGVSNELTISYVIEEADDAHLPLLNRGFFLLHSSKDVIYAVPLAIFEEATLHQNGRDSVRIRSGLLLDGVLSGTIRENPTQGSVYDLRQIVSIKTVGPQKNASKAEMKPAQLWSVEYASGQLGPLRLINPTFGFQYTNTYDRIVQPPYYERATGEFSGSDTAFKLKVGSEIMTANIPDFAVISLMPGTVPKVRVTAPTGRTTEGELILTRGGTPIKANNWYVKGIVPKSGGLIAIIEQPQCTITRIP